jgi:hypothetical protein
VVPTMLAKSTWRGVLTRFDDVGVTGIFEV